MMEKDLDETYAAIKIREDFLFAAEQNAGDQSRASIFTPEAIRNAKREIASLLRRLGL
jgi:hypothetical protein